MTKEELKKDIYYELRDRFKHTTDPYRDIATFALNEFFADYVANKLSTHIVSNCKHENEQMHQGDGFVYVTCKDCGTDL